jgi:hypothetical protein
MITSASSQPKTVSRGTKAHLARPSQVKASWSAPSERKKVVSQTDIGEYLCSAGVPNADQIDGSAVLHLTAAYGMMTSEDLAGQYRHPSVAAMLMLLLMGE